MFEALSAPIVAAFATFLALIALVIVTACMPIFRIEFQTGNAPLWIAVVFYIAIPLTQADDKNFVYMRGRIDPQIEAGDLELKYAVVDESPNPSRDVHLVSRNSPLGAYEFTTLRHGRTGQQ